MYICSECGYQSVKWMGKCPNCGGWETFRQKDSKLSSNKLKTKVKSSPRLLKDISELKKQRHQTNFSELDRILGGGLVSGQVILIGGEPGVGKSTLLLEVASNLSKEGKTMYVSAEESPQQIGVRARRLKNVSSERLYISDEERVENIYKAIEKEQFKFVVIDSIQVMTSSFAGGVKGSVLSIRSCADYLTQVAKTLGVIIFIVGHVTKSGAIAGPKLLEHVVDSVLYFEGEILSNYRILRSIKNRFGPTGDIAVFDMTSTGLSEVKKINDIFLPHKKDSSPGSCVICPLEGLRPILVELQSLVSRANFSTVRRRSLGFDFNRFSLLVAIIEKRLKVPISGEDIFLNVAGGLRINDPAADLGAVVAIISSFLEKKVPPETAFVGEVGLGGELRRVRNINSRLKEIDRANFRCCYIPEANRKEVDKRFLNKVLSFSNLGEIYRKLFKVT
ncbi:MAG: DNA repair protein RadA [Candidatus Omnitrophica bacterium]|nr:DNA repair protein RadA [Candidatus Omnitrophota bacterium]MCF7893743.1 DNA repair protein RadA [Candidatus Omnitrophota bacterium]